MTLLDRVSLPSRIRRAAMVAATTLVLPLVAAAAVTAPGAAAADACSPTTILENPCRPLLGAESNGYLPGATFPDRMAEHESRIERPVDLVHIYVTTKPTITSYERSVASAPDKIALVNWRLTKDWAKAADGSLDADIDVMADSLKSLPHQVMLTIAHEPEIHLTPGGDPACPASAGTDSRGTSADYVAMWHHVRDRFDADGVDNVVWVMNYLGYVKYFGCAQALWPGNSYVDWVMWDPYPNGQSYAETVGGFYDYLSTHSDAGHDFLSKPWGLAEWGYTGKSQEAAYAMYADATSALHANTFPRLKAYLIWDNLVAGGNDDRVGYDSEGNPDLVEQAAYNAFANDPTFSPDSTPPSTVPDLAADAVTARSTHLTWGLSQDEVRVAGYRVSRNGGVIGTVGPDVHGFTDAGLADAHTYHYTVVAFDPSGNASPSSTLTVSTPDATAPKVPTSVKAALSGTSVKLTWKKPSDNVGVTSYAVYRGRTLIGTPTTPAFTDTAAPQGTRPSYTVRALDRARNTSAASSAVAITVPDRTRPTNPSSLKATPGSRRVTLSWKAASDNVAVTRYWLYRGTTRIAVLSAASRSYANTGLRKGTSYSYRLVALDAAGNQSTGLRATAKAK